MPSHHYFDIIAGVVLVCSLIGSILPPYEVFSFAPRFQVVYRILVVFVGTVGALNLRSITMKLYPSYQKVVTNGKTTSDTPAPPAPPTA